MITSMNEEQIQEDKTDLKLCECEEEKHVLYTAEGSNSEAKFVGTVPIWQGLGCFI